MKHKVSLLTLMLATLNACTTVPTSPVQAAPEALKAPADQSFTFDFAAEGVQIYACKTNAKDSNKYEWVFLAPEAKLFDQQGNVVGKHYAGPSWESNDGSKVVGEVVARADSADANAIPLLLLKAKSNSGTGIFSQVKSIQRVSTKDGKAPNITCDGSNLGKEVRIAYTARYNFFR